MVKESTSEIRIHANGIRVHVNDIRVHTNATGVHRNDIGMTYERNMSALYCVKIYITTSYGKKIYTDIQQLQQQKVKFANSEDQFILLQGCIVLYLNHSK